MKLSHVNSCSSFQCNESQKNKKKSILSKYNPSYYHFNDDHNKIKKNEHKKSLSVFINNNKDLTEVNFTKPKKSSVVYNRLNNFIQHGDKQIYLQKNHNKFSKLNNKSQENKYSKEYFKKTEDDNKKPIKTKVKPTKFPRQKKKKKVKSILNTDI